MPTISIEELSLDIKDWPDDRPLSVFTVGDLRRFFEHTATDPDTPKEAVDFIVLYCLSIMEERLVLGLDGKATA